MTETDIFIESQIYLYGERYRRIISSAIQFLINNESSWKLDKSINKSEYIKRVLNKDHHA